MVSGLNPLAATILLRRATFVHGFEEQVLRSQARKLLGEVEHSSNEEQIGDSMSKERRRRASNGVIIFSSLIILIGTISFLSITISFFQLRLQLQFKDFAPLLFSQLPNATLNLTAFWLSTVLSLLIMFCWIVAGIGILLLKEWARQLLLISMGVYFLNKVIDIFINISIISEYGEKIPVLALCIGIGFVFALTISITYFFTHPKVIKQFNRSRRTFR